MGFLPRNTKFNPQSSQQCCKHLYLCCVRWGSHSYGLGQSLVRVKVRLKISTIGSGQWYRCSQIIMAWHQWTLLFVFCFCTAKYNPVCIIACKGQIKNSYIKSFCCCFFYLHFNVGIFAVFCIHSWNQISARRSAEKKWTKFVKLHRRIAIYMVSKEIGRNQYLIFC